MANVMQKSESVLYKLEPTAEVDLLRQENELLRQEISSLKEQVSKIQNVASGPTNAAQVERDAILYYLEYVSRRIGGIPALAKLIREVIADLIINIKSSEHLNKNKYQKHDDWRKS